MILSLLLAFSCDKSGTNPQPTLEPEEVSLYFVLGDGSHSSSCSAEFTAAGGSQALTLHSSAAWTASCDADWLEAPASGDAGDVSFKMTAVANPDMEAQRTATVKVVSGGLSCTVSVLQGELPGFVVETTEFEIGSEGGEIRVPIATNTEYAAEVLGDAASWLSVGELRTKGLEDCVMVLEVAANENYEGRVGQVRVSGAGKESVLTVTQLKADPTAGVEYVDLGLSVLWATCNLGATAPEELGDPYSWGETSTKDVDGYMWSSSYDPLGDGANGNDDIGSDISGTQYDAAHVKLGGKWRMPTREESNELRENTTVALTTVNGVEGVLLTSTVEGYSDMSIFMPSTKYMAPLGDEIELGYYWTATQSEEFPDFAYTIVFNEEIIFPAGGATCISLLYEPKHIRPVCDKE